MTIIKSTNGNIFGGFTEKAWVSTSGYVKDPKAFIISLVKKDNKPFKAMISCQVEKWPAILCDSKFGQSFGFGDLWIASGSNSNQDSRSNFGTAYYHADYDCGTEKAKSILAGSYNFQTIEIEVFVHKN